MHARCELDGADIVYLARCGNYQGSVGKNSDYGEGLRRVLECLNEHSVGIREVTVDSKQARSLPLEDRVILVEAEAEDAVEWLFTQLSRRMREVGLAPPLERVSGT